MSETGVKMIKMTKKDCGRRIPITLIDLLVIVAIVGIIAAIVIPNFIQASRRAPYAVAAGDAREAVRQAIIYARDHGVYPTSIKEMREGEIVYCACRDKDPWGNDYVLSPLLTEGRTPKEGDNVYVFSRGPKGTGVYPEPFTSNTGEDEDGSIGYSSVDGCFAGPLWC